MSIKEKALEILGRLTAELDGIGVEYQIMFGRISEEETFGQMVYSDNFNVYRTIESLERTLVATKALRDELEAKGATRVFSESEEKRRRSIQ